VYLRWLADLYTSIGELDAAQASYQRVLVLNPYDLGTSNMLATFLLEQRRDAKGAEKLLAQTAEWGSKAMPRPLYLGQTYALHARALRELGRYDEALAATERATAMLDPDAAEDALRTQAISLRELGKDDDAIDAFEHLIGLTGGSNADDVNALISIVTKKRGSIDAERFRERVRTAIDTARREREESLRHDGAEMVVLEGELGVRLEGTLRRGKGTAAVLFVPDLGGRRSLYRPYEQLFALDGFTTFSIDPRGHGDSRCDSLPSFAQLSADQRDRIPSDIARAREYLSHTLEIPPDRIAVIVAGAASADVEHAMHGLNLGAIVVHLSPVFDPLDRDIAAAIAFRPPRPALMLVSEEDYYSMQSVDAMRTARPGDPITVKNLRSSGHGVIILHKPENFAMITDWLNGQIASSR
jgi:tetratricopeptide (TPR) repeat protein